MKLPRIMTSTDSYVTVYPEFIKLADTQFEDCRWTANEIAVEKDKQDMLVNMSPAAKHAVTTGLKLFTRYEMFAGTEYWLGRVIKAFPRPEIQRLASVNGMMELHVHAPFYNKLNEVLGLDTDEFYTSYVNDPILNERVKFLDSMVDDPDDLLSIAVFSLIEGAILFSSFALFKSFQSNGNNLIGNVVRGIDQSVIDEGLHQTGGAMIFRTALKEMWESIPLWDQFEQAEFIRYKQNLEAKIIQAGIVLFEHEARINKMLFAKGDIGTGYKEVDANSFVKRRLNVCVSDLGFEAIFKDVLESPVEKWFYGGVQKFQMNDFFVGQGREYTSHWNEKKFAWPKGE